MISPDELRAVPLFSDLTDDQLRFVARSAEDIRLIPGEFVAREGDERALFVVIEGRAELSKEVGGIERVVGKRHPGQVFGEVPVLLSTKLPASMSAAEPSRVVKLDAASLVTLIALAPHINDALSELAVGRMRDLRVLATEAARPELTVMGPMVDPRVHLVCTFLVRNEVQFESVNSDDPANAERLAGASAFPVLDRADGTRMVEPDLREVARASGLPVDPLHDSYDLVIIGGGPTGLTAAVNGAAEGLRTLIVERFAPGGQAGTSSRIENYTGFPFGVSGDDLASRALRQAKRLGSELVVTRTVQSINPDARTITLDGGATIAAKVILLATGVEWRRLPLERIEHFVGNGVYYGAARSDAANAHGKNVYIVGAGNSAGQAAIFFSRHSKSVHLIVRGESLAASMSQYLIDQIAANPHITVETRSEVTALHGDDDLTAIDVTDRRSGASTRRDAEVLFVMIGADAETSWLPGPIARDANGFVLTGAAAKTSSEWTAEREPFALETTVPGIFAAGDVRSGSVKRVAAGVGEGGMAVAFAHQYLAL
ncbi:thioredoxin reductase (NADPH) [Microbacteriaceae bacterium SG_E_30_P1]|uniref:Thioredoxin reductase (NADPH) n=1 Tax=Antiquaquibacter oligotrophicus TaxID=2880260 RepID=A0ABT6KR40_9MICO|nr:FAD-dependent oxidoreductase [Antiquaquibacter oligotrophicus]MDH6182446.1 thioredoxin reductase (NADPH) [Antiquaquibacter oligotrophicus]UDF14583.1 FAD-dependent oxidoreductase [Antiquaquibacter oligotrophicus]